MMKVFMYLIVNGVIYKMVAMSTATLVKVEIQVWHQHIQSSIVPILIALKPSYWDKKLRSFKI